MKNILFSSLFILFCGISFSQDDTEINIYAPNSFTVDDNNINDAWRTYSDVIWDDFLVEVYNPWGQLVWFSTDPLEWWMGEGDMYNPQHYSMNGSYHYILKARKDNKIYTKLGVIYKLR
jgi:hypothetical protein